MSLKINKILLINTMVFCFIWGAISFAFYFLRIGDFFEKNFELPLLFQVRDKLGKTPGISDKLSIFAFDDTSFAVVERPFLTAQEWYGVMEKVSRASPGMIIVPKIFSDLPDYAEVGKYSQKIGELNIPIVAGFFISSQAIAKRESLDLQGPQGKFVDFFNIRDKAVKYAETFVSPLPARGYIYGPRQQYLDNNAFRYLGHVMSIDDNRFVPLTVFQNLILPHISLYAAAEKKLDFSRLDLDGISVPIDKSGFTHINYIPMLKIFSRVKSMKKLLSSAEPDYAKNSIKPGNIVLILTQLFTGGTQFIQSPFGKVPVDFQTAAVVNSILSKAWIEKYDIILYCLAIFLVVGALLGLVRSLMVFFPSFFLIILGTAIIQQFLFSYHNIIVVSSLPLLAFSGIALTSFAYNKAQEKERKILTLRALEAEKKRLELEVRDAAHIAKAFFTDELPKWPFCTIEVFHKPFTEASGDWFAFEKAPSESLYHFILCDIAGHGVQGAIVVSTCKTVLSMIVKQVPEPRETDDFICSYAELLNSTLYLQGNCQHITTMLAATFDPGNNRLLFFSAAHPVPVILCADGKQKDFVLYATPKYNPLGILPDIKPKVGIAEFLPGEEMIAFTDGIPLRSYYNMVSRPLGADWRSKVNTPFGLYEALWEAERLKTGLLPDDDVSVVWFKREKT